MLNIGETKKYAVLLRRGTEDEILAELEDSRKARELAEAKFKAGLGKEHFAVVVVKISKESGYENTLVLDTKHPGGPIVDRMPT